MQRLAVASLTVILGGAVAVAGDDRRLPRRLDVTVMDRHGQPVRGLAPGDFELHVDGAPRRILSAEFRTVPRFTTDPVGDIDGPTDEERVAREPGVRTFVFYLDEANVTQGLPASRARQAVDDFIDQKVHARDLTLVVRPRDRADDLRFSRDRAWAHGATAAFAGRRGRLGPSHDTLRALLSRLCELAPDRAVLVLVSEADDAGLEDIARLASAARVTVYTFDPSGGTRPPDGRRWLAARTGGLAIDAATTIAGFARIAHDTEAWVTLTFDPGPPDDRIHTIALTSRGAGVTLRAATGFWSAERVRVGAGDAKRAAATDAPRRMRASAAIDTWIGLARGRSDGATLTVTWEPARSAASHAERVTVTARDAAGTLLTHTTLGDVGRAGRGIGDCARFDAPIGTIALDLTVLDDAGRVLDSEAREVDVPDFAAAAAAGVLVLPIEIRRTRSREDAPAAARAFSRADRLQIRVPTTDDGVVVTARLEDRTGHTIRALEALPRAALEPAEFSLPLASLAPAQYQIEVIGRGSDGRTHIERAVFRIED